MFLSSYVCIQRHRCPGVVALLAIAAVVASLPASASAGIIANTSPNFQQTGDYADKYTMLNNGGGSPDKNAGFYLLITSYNSGDYDEFGDLFGVVQAEVFVSAYSSTEFKNNALFNSVVDGSSGQTAGWNYLSDGTYYVALNFKDQLNANKDYYGWMDITVSGVGGTGAPQFTLNAWAYENTGASIRVGQLPVTNSVPEIDPAGLGAVLALLGGVLGLVERRRLKVA